MLDQKQNSTPISEKKLEAGVEFERALDLAGFGKYNYALLIISNVVLLAMVLEMFGVSFVVTSSQCDLGLTTKTKGLIAAMPMLGIVLSAHLWGWLADTRGRKSVLLISMAGSWLFSVVSSFATVWPVLAVCKFFSAFFAAASNAVTFALLGECTPMRHRNKLVLLTSSGLMFGQGLMSILAFPILHASFKIFMPFLDAYYRPWRLLEQAYGAGSLLAVFLLWRLKESPKFLISRGREAESLKVLSEIYAINTGRDASEYPVKSLIFEESTVVSKNKNVLRSIWDQTTPLFRPPLLNKTMVISYIVIIVYAIPPSFMMWMPTIANAFSRSISSGASNDQTFCELLNSARHVDHGIHNSSYNSTIQAPAECVDSVEGLVYVTLLGLSTVLTAVNTMNSFLLRVIGKKVLVIAIHVISGVSGIMLPLVRNTWAGVFIFGCFQLNLVSMALTTGFTVELYPTYLRAMGVCLTMMIGRGAAFLAINLVGRLLETHCEETFFGLGVFILSGALVGLLLPNDLKRNKSISKA